MDTTEAMTCPHCDNFAPMEICAHYLRKQESTFPLEFYEGQEEQDEEGDVYNLLRCYRCNEMTLMTYYWSEIMEPGDVINITTLYPTHQNLPVGLPINIQLAFRSALKIKYVDINIYGIVLRRILEMACLDKGAVGYDLHKKIKDLSNKGELPLNLVGVALGLKDLGNIGTHPNKGSLTQKEIALLEDLTRAVLEYLYSITTQGL